MGVGDLSMRVKPFDKADVVQGQVLQLDALVGVGTVLLGLSLVCEKTA